MHSEWTDQLSAYLDDELAPESRLAVERHLASCEACSRILAELRAVTTWAASYQGRAPERDLWPGVRRRIEGDKVVSIGRTVGLPWRQLVAAGLAAMLIGGGAVWLAIRGGSVEPAPDTAPVAVAASISEADLAVRDLESLLESGRAELDSSTVRVIEESLALIDLAIAEAKVAIQRDSANEYLNSRIAAHLKQKVAILRTATRAARDL